MRAGDAKQARHANNLYSSRKAHTSAHDGGRALFQSRPPAVVAAISVAKSPEFVEALRAFVKIVDQNISGGVDVAWGMAGDA